MFRNHKCIQKETKWDRSDHKKLQLMHGCFDLGL